MTNLSHVLTPFSQTSSPYRGERRLALVAAGLIVFIGLQLLWLGVTSLLSAGVKPIPPTIESLRVEPLETPRAITATDSLQVQARPLFWQSRRPTSAPTSSFQDDDELRSAASRELKQLEVTGVFGAGDLSGAIIAHKGERMRLLVGDEVEGWTLISVDPDQVVFASAGARDVRRLQSLPIDGYRPPSGAETQSPSAGSTPSNSQPNTNSKANAPVEKPKKDAKDPSSFSLGG